MIHVRHVQCVWLKHFPLKEIEKSQSVWAQTHTQHPKITNKLSSSHEFREIGSYFGINRK